MKVLLEQGEATLSNIGQLRNARLGQAILLSGGNGRYELITPETSLEMVTVYLGRYKYFVKLSTTHQETVEKAEARSADGRKFRLTIKIGARLADPLAFVRAYGHDSSLLAPFHRQTLSDVQNLLLSYTQSQVDAVSAQLAMRFGAVATQRPVYDGVELQEYIVNVEQDPDVRREMIAIETTSIYDRFGSRGLAALMLRHPKHGAEISAFADDLLALRGKAVSFDDIMFERALRRANQLEADGVIGQAEKAQFLQLHEPRNAAQPTLVTPSAKPTDLPVDATRRPLPGSTEVSGDRLACTAYSPKRVASSSTFLIQGAVHMVARSEEADNLALNADSVTSVRGRTSLTLPVERGEHIVLHLEVEGADVDEPVQTVIWAGETILVGFEVATAASWPHEHVIAKLRVYLGDIPVAAAKWRLDLVSKADSSRLSDLNADIADRRASTARIDVRSYRSAFVSYASEDRLEVLKRVQGVEIAWGSRVFVDLLDLDPGQRWERELYRQIDSADVFLLFWSAHAAQSEWVEKEWRHALDCLAKNDDQRPDIRPVVLELPFPPPPKPLADRHFNDRAIHLIAGLAAAKDKRA